MTFVIVMGFHQIIVVMNDVKRHTYIHTYNEIVNPGKIQHKSCLQWIYFSNTMVERATCVPECLLSRDIPPLTF